MNEELKQRKHKSKKQRRLLRLKEKLRKGRRRAKNKSLANIMRSKLRGQTSQGSKRPTEATPSEKEQEKGSEEEESRAEDNKKETGLGKSLQG